MSSSSSSDTLARPVSLGLPLAGALAGLGWFALLVAESIRRAGVFEYPLDDVYIHLAMASGIAGGTYGVNPGEPASAASSILYPLLLLPFPGSGFQRMLPLIWNGVAVAACGWLWGRALAEARLTGAIAALGIAAGPLALNMAGVGFTGMEHAIQTALAMAGILGLWLWLDRRELAGWFVAVLIVAPLVRYEGLALTLLCAFVLAVTGRRGSALGIAAATLAALALFSLYLLHLGLSPLPSSVLVKLEEGRPESLGPISGLVAHVEANLVLPSGWFLALLTVVSGVAALTGHGEGSARVLLGVAAAAGAALLVVGRVGWMSRYETHATALLAMALVLGWQAAWRRAAVSTGTILMLSLVAGIFAYGPLLWAVYLGNPDYIYRQHAQMARFSHDFARVPVAVNDIGRVGWNAPAYMLDLWGLAYQPARVARLTDGAPEGWAAALAAGKGIRYAMVYDAAIGRGIGADWVAVGRLDTGDGRLHVGGGDVVSFYATDPAFAPELRAATEAWARDLPPGARWEPVP